ncbi:hypothetical protein [Acidianus brierleyi]|uniref:Uncharacterized protein n=1 Tax=Acidianus brierleyi TaxID=41673 RepID=A0A2U9IE89_9CREN|nr:hypothetical protein [Acidianus brierleyi]AWR94368.1 hypothetical protein DFR85_06930 [Acidianus brierleyi]
MLGENSAKKKLVLDLINGKTIAIPLDTNITIIITVKNNKIKKKVYFKNTRNISKEYRDLVIFPIFITI